MVVKKDMFGQKNRQLSTILIANSLLSLAYGYFISFNGPLFNNILTISYIIVSFVILIKSFTAVTHEDHERNTIKFLISLAFSVHLFVILGTALASPKDALFWVVDSYEMHIPGSVRIMKALTGETGFDFVRTSIYDRTYIAHIFGAIFFIIFGVNHIASSLSLIIPKLICCYFIFKATKEFLGYEEAKIATLIYIFLPTAIFYTTTFYKEASLQMLVAIIYYVMILAYKNFKLKYLLILAFLFLLLGNERHYLVPCFAVSALAFAIISDQVKWFAKVSIFLCCLAGYFIFTSYYYDISLSTLKYTIVTYKTRYSSYSDVNPINNSLPYPLLVVKFLFTPFLNNIKISTYTHYASLITWGSIPYQLIISIFCFSVFQLSNLKIYRNLLIILVTPFLIFILFFGYVAPYNGRLRDSFLPLIVMVSSYAVVKFKNRINLHWKKNA